MSSPLRLTYESRRFFDRFGHAIARHAGRLGPVERMDTGGRSVDEVCRASWEVVVRRLGPGASISG